jgi:hypothetical protein
MTMTMTFLSLSLSSGSYAVGSSSSSSITIADDDDLTVTVSVDADYLYESSSTSGANFIFTRNNSAESVTVNYLLSGGATAGDDYVGASSLSGSIVIPSGSISASVTVFAVDDSLDDNAELLWLDLADGSYSIGTNSSADLEIVDNDEYVTVNMDVDGSPRLSELGPSAATLVFSRTGAVSTALVINLALSGTATNGADYRDASTNSSVSTSVTIPVGQSSTSLSIVAVSDSDPDDEDSLIVAIAAGTGYTGGSSSSVTLAIDENGNVPPEAYDQSVRGMKNEAINGTLVASDADGDTFVFNSEDAPTNGTVVINANGTFQYEPNQGFVGRDSFTFSVTETNVAIPLTSQKATVQVQVGPSVVINSITYNNDHGVLRDGTFADDGDYFDEPEWVLGGPYNPISITMNQKLSMTVSFVVQPAGVHYRLIGNTASAIFNSDFGVSDINAGRWGTEERVATGQVETVTAMTERMPYDRIGSRYTTYAWSLELPGLNVTLDGPKTSNMMYITAADPKGAPINEERLAWAVGVARGEKTLEGALGKLHMAENNEQFSTDPSAQLSNLLENAEWEIAGSTDAYQGMDLVQLYNLALNSLGFSSGVIVTIFPSTTAHQVRVVEGDGAAQEVSATGMVAGTPVTVTGPMFFKLIGSEATRDRIVALRHVRANGSTRFYVAGFGEFDTALAAMESICDETDVVTGGFLFTVANW